MMLGVDFSAFTVLVSTIMQLTVVPVEVDSPHMEDVFCVALNAYHEARGEDFNELLAVSQVQRDRWVPVLITLRGATEFRGY